MRSPVIGFVSVSTDEFIQRLAALADTIWHECYADILTLAQIDYMVENLQSAEAISQQITSDGYEYFLITANGKETGYIGLQPENGRLYLSKLYLLKKFQGKGIGTAGLDFAEKLARQCKCDTIWLTVNRHNKKAIAAYERNGYTMVRTQVADIGGGFVMDDFVFEKTL